MPRDEDFDYGAFPAIPAGIENASPSDTINYSGVKGFMVDADGTLAIEAADGSEAAFPVLGGIQYAMDVKKFKSTGTVTVATITILY